MKISELLSRIGLAPKNLPEAQAAIVPAKQALDSVAALFTAAGLNLDDMLAAGPDALKAHLDSLAVADGALATAQARVAELETAAAEIAPQLTAALAEIDTLKAAQVTVKEQARQLLAASGHAAPIPAEVGASAARADSPKSDATLLAEYEAMPVGPERTKFFTQHEQALWRAHKSAKG